jgi:hypothetical protein
MNITYRNTVSHNRLPTSIDAAQAEEASLTREGGHERLAAVDKLIGMRRVLCNQSTVGRSVRLARAGERGHVKRKEELEARTGCSSSSILLYNNIISFAAIYAESHYLLRQQCEQSPKCPPRS